MHPIRGGLNYNLELRWDGVPSLADALRMLKEQAARTPAPQWVRVIGGWNEFQFAERRMPTLDEINAVAPDTPVFVMHLYDRALLNGAALRAVGYDKERPGFPGRRGSTRSPWKSHGSSHRQAQRQHSLFYARQGTKALPRRSAQLFSAVFPRTKPLRHHQRDRCRRWISELSR